MHKVRWREHELLLVTIVAVLSIAGYIWRIFDLSQGRSTRSTEARLPAMVLIVAKAKVNRGVRIKPLSGGSIFFHHNLILVDFDNTGPLIGDHPLLDPFPHPFIPDPAQHFSFFQQAVFYRIT